MTDADLLSLITRGLNTLRQMREGDAWARVEDVLAAYGGALSDHQRVLAARADAEAQLVRRQGEIERTIAALEQSLHEATAAIEKQQQDSRARMTAEAASWEEAKRLLAEQTSRLKEERQEAMTALAETGRAHAAVIAGLTKERREAEQARDAALASLRAVRDGIQTA